MTFHMYSSVYLTRRKLQAKKITVFGVTILFRNIFKGFEIWFLVVTKVERVKKSEVATYFFKLTKKRDTVHYIRNTQ